MMVEAGRVEQGDSSTKPPLVVCVEGGGIVEEGVAYC